MSYQPRHRRRDQEVWRRRAVALGALGAALVLFMLAIVFAFAGSGGENSTRSAAATNPPKAQKKKPRRNRRAAAAPAGAVPASAPGAHKAPNEPVPVLAYSVINNPKPDTANPEDWVPPDEFEAQISYLQSQGYHVVTLRQVWAAWKEGGLLPSKPIVISFDTGYPSVYANALPVLRRQHWVGTLFLQPSQTQADFSTSQVKGLLSAGWELDAQSATGADLTSLSDEQLDQEIAGARHQLQRDYRAKVQFFSYPGGQSDERIIEAVRSAGFLGAVTLDEGEASPQDDPFQLKRIQIANGDGEQGLAGKLSSFSSA